MWFEASSGLKINLGKSNFILVGRVENLEDLASIIGCKVGDLPTTYLGLPLGAPSNYLTIWDGMEEGFHKRDNVEKIVYFQRGEAYTDLEHVF